MISWLLVALQFVLIGALIATTRPPNTVASNSLCALLLAAAAAVGIAALRRNPLSNFNIRPEVKPGARLVTSGIYRRVRHPIYVAVLLATAAPLAADPRLWRLGMWPLLLAVLIAKLLREERYLRAQFPEYADYQRHTCRLLPGIY
jgi:protein-S-isoprenylcysteine O-methyltransferase Ste14